ncbi:hypothetical protein LINGRAHAP2_LOCUS9162 [Linum grandiflorum]
MPPLQTPFSSPIPSRNTVHHDDDPREFDFWATAEARYFQSLRHGRLDQGSTAGASFPSHKRTVSSQSYLQSVADGRKQMMKMVGDMPDSCFELSLKDIVNEVKGQRIEEEDDLKDRSFQFETEDQMKKQSWLKKMIAKNKESTSTVSKPPLYGRVPRSCSLDTGTVFIKVFNLAPLSWKTNRNGKKWKTGEIRHGSSIASSSRSSSSCSGCSSDGSTSGLRSQRRIPVALAGCFPLFCTGTQKIKQHT